jgi:type I restriction enzyme S subunit
MKPETFFDNFEVLADAPNGVQKLREMVLQLAVRGNLVAQDEKDEPAAELLKRIKTERDRLIKALQAQHLKKYLARISLKSKFHYLPLPNSAASSPELTSSCFSAISLKPDSCARRRTARG